MNAALELDPKVAELIYFGSREEWLAGRRSGIGASEAAALFSDPETGRSVSPWLTPLKLYAQKVAPSQEPDAPSEAMELGLLLEPAIAEMARRRLDVEVQEAPPHSTYRSRLVPAMTASPDRFLVVDGVVGVLELKTTAGWNKDEWRDDDGEPFVPLHYQIQVQQQLAVTGLAFGRVALLIGGQQFESFEVPRNEAFIETLQERVAEFWARVERREAPTAQAGDYEAVKLLHPRPAAGKTITLGPIGDELLDRWYAAEERAKAAEADVDACKAEVAQLLGDAEVAQLADGRKFTFKTRRTVIAPQPEKSWESRVLVKPRRRST